MGTGMTFILALKKVWPPGQQNTKPRHIVQAPRPAQLPCSLSPLPVLFLIPNLGSPAGATLSSLKLWTSWYPLMKEEHTPKHPQCPIVAWNINTYTVHYFWAFPLCNYLLICKWGYFFSRTPSPLPISTVIDILRQGGILVIIDEPIVMLLLTESHGLH